MTRWWILLALICVGCAPTTPDAPKAETRPPTKASPTELATFGNGCFWCTEAVFDRLKGVKSVVSGYSGGRIKNPSYRQISTGTTGHAEVVQIEFDPATISYQDLLAVFFQSHDPTTLNRQGDDVGPQYRSVVFYHTDEQKRLAESAKAALQEAKIYADPIVTEIAPFEAFYQAEDYHQRFFEQNRTHAYCRFVIRPKLEKLQAVFREKLKD